jgi:A/G-specific adenine glycosylase
MTPRARTALQKKLLTWFDRHRRDLPWRADRDPYRIWVSEVMLQQTTVAAVVPYFERFLSAFPTVHSLAAADEQQVLKLWEGLGYYRRARHLHAAARRIAETASGQLPNDPALWAELPGVGRYILGAVLSQAFDRRLPIVEANSRRVLTRLLGYRSDPRSGDGQKWIWSAAESLLPLKRAGDFNQALMELGALVCRNDSPSCGRCPLASHCLANRDGLQGAIPSIAARKPIVEVGEVAVAIRDGDKLLLGRRPPDAARWQNMWELPHGVRGQHEGVRSAARRMAKELTGLNVSIGRQIAVIRHGVTRYSITMTCFEATRQSGRRRSPFFTELRWVAPSNWHEYPVSTPQRKLLTHLDSSSTST